MKSLLRHLRGCHSDLAKPSIFLEPDYPRLHLFVAAIRLLPFRFKPEGISHIIRHDILRINWKGPYYTYSDAPKKDRDLWFNEFKRLFAWHPNEELKAKKHFKAKIQKVISDAFSKRRKGKDDVDEYTLPEFVQPEHVALILDKQREDQKLAKQIATGKECAKGKNKALYTHHHGSEPSFKSYTRLESKRGEVVPPTEFYVCTHTNKKTGIVDPQALQFSESMEGALQARSAIDPVFASLPRAQQELQLWSTVQGNSDDSGTEYRGLGSQVEFYQSDFSSSSTGRSSVNLGCRTNDEFTQQLELLQAQIRAQAEASQEIKMEATCAKEEARRATEELRCANEEARRAREEARRAYEESNRTQQRILSLLTGSRSDVRPSYAGPPYPPSEDATGDAPDPFGFTD